MKAIYNTRMKEYVTELTFISEKLKKYDEILTKKKEKKKKSSLLSHLRKMFLVLKIKI